MKKLSFLLFVLLTVWGNAQSLLQPNYHIYLGNSINNSGISLLGERPYFGIGKKQVLAQLPYIFSQGGMIDFTPFLGSSVFGIIRPYAQLPSRLSSSQVGLYGSSFREWEASANIGFSAGQTQNSIVASYAQNQHKMDSDADTWLDLPLQKRTFLLGRSKIEMSNGKLSVGGFYMHNKVQDGEFAYDENTSNTAYGFGNTMEHAGASVQFSHDLKYNSQKRTSSELLAQVDGVYHDRNVFFGTKLYTGTQRDLHAQVGYALKVMENNRFFLGTTFDYTDVSERFADLDYTRTERSIGLLARYENHLSKHLYAAVNMELGRHNLQKTYMRPSAKLNFIFPNNRYLNLTLYTAYDWRYANIFSDFSRLFVSDYQISFDTNNLQPNKATQVGLAGSYLFNTRDIFNNIRAKLSYNYFHYHQKTLFDMSWFPESIIIYSTSGRAYRSTLELRAQGNFDIISYLSLGFSYRWDKVYSDYSIYSSSPESDFFLPKHNFYTSLIYNREEWNLSLKLNYHAHSPQQFPTILDPVPWLHRLDFRGQYQLDKVKQEFLKPFTFLLGVDNLLGQQQEQSIFSRENIWGTLYGTRAFLGIEYRLQ